MKLRFTPLALAEIDGILADIASRSPQGARNVRNRLRRVAGLLRDQPHIGRITDVPPVRRIGLRPYPYTVFYRVAEREVVVIGLHRAARDPSTMPGADDVAS